MVEVIPFLINEELLMIRCKTVFAGTLLTAVLVAMAVQAPGKRLAERSMTYCLPLTVGQ